MRVYLVCHGGYNSCSHLGIYLSREAAIARCIDKIKEEIKNNNEHEIKTIKELKDNVATIDIRKYEYQDLNEKLQAALDKGEFNEGGGSIDLPWIEEFEVDCS
jgi:hypothetical protein